VNLPRFDVDLMRVINVLVSTAATAPEVRTRWFDAMWRSFVKIDNFRFGELFFFARYFYRNPFAIDGQWDENGLSLITRDSFSAESDIRDF